MLNRKKCGIEVIIETQGGSGIENELLQSDIDEAFCVILSNDLEIRNKDRFKGKKVLQMVVSELISKSESIMLSLARNK